MVEILQPHIRISPIMPFSILIRYGTRCAASAASIAVPILAVVKEKEKEESERYQLGSCLLHHIPHGGYVSGLSKGVSIDSSLYVSVNTHAHIDPSVPLAGWLSLTLLKI